MHVGRFCNLDSQLNHSKQAGGYNDSILHTKAETDWILLIGCPYLIIPFSLLFVCEFRTCWVLRESYEEVKPSQIEFFTAYNTIHSICICNH